MKFSIIFFTFLLLVVHYIGVDAAAKCAFPAIYNFGDSNSDTGGRLAAALAKDPPQTFFGKSYNRHCDGRLIIDFIAAKLGLPFVNAYMDSNGTNFKHGVNFAVGGASIRVGGYSSFHLGIQIAQFVQFKSRAMDLSKRTAGKQSSRQNNFSKALYTFDIGQNDLAIGFQYNPEEHVRALIPDILNRFSQAVHQLYNQGARYIWVHNTGPIGCLPYNVIYYHYKKGHLDRNGCVEPQNKVAREFNRQLKHKISMFAVKFQNAAFTYVDVYAAKYALVGNARKQGFKDPMKFCCGSYYGYHIDCGKSAIVNGTEYGKPCDNPGRHISWDGVHYSQAANLWVSRKILNSSSLIQACHRDRDVVGVSL